jgi:hypothetical protein
VPFDPDYFARRAALGQAFQPAEAFRHAYQTNLWAGAESRSGPGSGLDQTAALREGLPDLCRRYGVRVLLDLPCGDWRWMAWVPLPDIQVIGADLLPELAEQNTLNFGVPGRRFTSLDLTRSPLPEADLLLCRDCLVHFSFADIGRALSNIRGSRITWLLTTTFPGQPANREIVTGDWRPINLTRPPVNLPEPVELLNEGCTEGAGVFADKSLGLWRVSDLPDALASA